MASNQCDRVNRCKNSWWCAVDYNPANKDCFEPMTHCDKLRAKNDEELALWIADRSFGCPPGCSPAPLGCDDVCVDCWLDWLRQEAD